MVTDLAEIRKRTEEQRSENIAFRRYLEAHHRPHEPFRIIAAKVEAEIDCRQCANCCREMTVDVRRAEIAAIAQHLGATSAEVVRLYTDLDPDDSARRILKSGREGCVFLDGNLCLIYEARPDACRAFPHISAPRRSLGSRMASVCEHAKVCPIVFNALEEYKHSEGYPAISRRAAAP